MKRKNNRGITLIALIITIILMLILAGVVLSLTIGENGLFKTAKYAVQKNSEETAREKLELALADLQAHKYTNVEYDENEYINSYLRNEGMQVVDDIVTVDEWKFEIDRRVPKIGQSLGQEEIKLIKISTPYVGTRSVTTKVQYIVNEEEIESYTYMLDGEEIITNKNKEYALEDYLEPETTHKVQVIAKYKNNLTVESNVVTIKTKARTYLFNNGDTCEEITGGWSAEAGPDYPDVTMVAPTLTFNEEEKAMNVYLETSVHWITVGILKVNKKIDYKQYKKICVEAVAELSTYNHSSCISLNYSNAGGDYYNDGTTICYEHPISTKTKFELNLYELEEVEDIYFQIQSSEANGPVECAIYNVWLEQ